MLFIRMRFLVVLLLIFNLQALIAQENITYANMSKYTCDCLTRDGEEITKETMQTCVTTTFETHKTTIDSLVALKKEQQTKDKVPDKWLEVRVQEAYLEFILDTCKPYKDFFDELLLSKRNAVESKIVAKACQLLKDKEKEKTEISITEVSSIIHEAYKENQYEMLSLLDGQDNTSISRMSSRLFSKLKETCDSRHFKTKH